MSQSVWSLSRLSVELETMERVYTTEKLVVLPVSPLQALCNTEGKIKNDTYSCTPHVEELVALMNGECCIVSDVYRVMTTLYPEVPKYGDNQPDYDFTIQCKDYPFNCHAAVVRRRFQLIDDYINDTGACTISVPFTYGQVSRSVEVWEVTQLSECYECLLHLNPKSNMYPFHYSMEGMTLDRVQYLFNRLTPADLAQLNVTAARQELYAPTPLSVFPSFRVINDFTMQYYAEMPSYLFMLMYKNRHVRGSVNPQFILNAPYHKDADKLVDETEAKRVIRGLLRHVLETQQLTREHFCKCLAMLSVRHSSLDNVDMKVEMPWCVELEDTGLSRAATLTCVDKGPNTFLSEADTYSLCNALCR